MDLNSRKEAAGEEQRELDRQAAEWRRAKAAGQLEQQREQRSPSLSSSSSSTLFCSASSLASASAPILASGRRSHSLARPPPPPPPPLPPLRSPANQRPILWRHLCPTIRTRRPPPGSHYERNLQTLLAYANGPMFGQAPPGAERQGESESARARQPATQEASSLLKDTDWPANHQLGPADTTSGRAGGPPGGGSWQLARQLFLAFSLRLSVSLIFQAPADCGQQERRPQERARGRRGQRSPLLGSAAASGSPGQGGHRARLDSLSSVNEFAARELEREACGQREQGEPEAEMEPAEECGRSRFCCGPRGRAQSVDSLHGLRFLSMIWIIVMHSYNFALQWLFFTNTSSLDNIYKTAASQLLANGTFACDSFLFAGGFLLPYLAFPAAQASGPPEVRKERPEGCGRAASGGCFTLVIAPGSELAAPQQPAVGGAAAGLECWQRRQEELGAQRARAQRGQGKASGGGGGERCELGGKATGATEAGVGVGVGVGTGGGRHLNTNEFTISTVLGNILHRYIRMMPLMMAIIGLSANLLRYLGEGPNWDESTMMFDKWCRKNWWINGLFLHNFLNRENMCLSHSWYSAVDIQLFLIGQVILFVLFRSRRFGLLICCILLFGAQLLTGVLTLIHHLPAVPLISTFSEQSMNLYYGEIYIKPYCRASPYLIGMLLAYLMRTTWLGGAKLNRVSVCLFSATFQSSSRLLFSLPALPCAPRLVSSRPALPACWLPARPNQTKPNQTNQLDSSSADQTN